MGQGLVDVFDRYQCPPYNAAVRQQTRWAGMEDAEWLIK